MLFLLVSTMVVCLWVSLSTVNWYFYCLYLFYCIFYLHHSEWGECIPSTLSGGIIYWLAKKVCSHFRGHWDTLLFIVQHCATFLVKTTSCPLLWAWGVEFLSSVNTFFLRNLESHSIYTGSVNSQETITTIIQFSSVAQSCPTLCDPMNRSMPGLPVHHQLPEFTQTHVHRVGDAI